nr:hypothetical protein CFP56_79602 [Quercus suber]
MEKWNTRQSQGGRDEARTTVPNSCSDELPLSLSHYYRSTAKLDLEDKLWNTFGLFKHWSLTNEVCTAGVVVSLSTREPFSPTDSTLLPQSPATFPAMSDSAQTPSAAQQASENNDSSMDTSESFGKGKGKAVAEDMPIDESEEDDDEDGEVGHSCE